MDIKELIEKLNTIPKVKITTDILFKKDKRLPLLNQTIKIARILELTDCSKSYRDFNHKCVTPEPIHVSKIPFEIKYRIAVEIFCDIFKLDLFSRIDLIDGTSSLYQKLFLRLWGYHVKVKEALSRTTKEQAETEFLQQQLDEIKKGVEKTREDKIEILTENTRMKEKAKQLEHQFTELEDIQTTANEERNNNSTARGILENAKTGIEQELQNTKTQADELKQRVTEFQRLLIPDQKLARQKAKERQQENVNLRKSLRDLERNIENLERQILHGTNVAYSLDKFNSDVQQLTVKARTKKELELYLANQQRIFEARSMQNESLKKEVVNLVNMREENSKRIENEKVNQEERVDDLRTEREDSERFVIQREVALRRIETEKSNVENEFTKTKNAVESEKIAQFNALLDFKNFSRELLEKQNEYKQMLVDGMGQCYKDVNELKLD